MADPERPSDGSNSSLLDNLRSGVSGVLSRYFGSYLHWPGSQNEGREKLDEFYGQIRSRRQDVATMPTIPQQRVSLVTLTHEQLTDTDHKDLFRLYNTEGLDGVELSGIIVDRQRQGNPFPNEQ